MVNGVHNIQYILANRHPETRFVLVLLLYWSQFASTLLSLSAMLRKYLILNSVFISGTRRDVYEDPDSMAIHQPILI